MTFQTISGTGVKINEYGLKKITQLELSVNMFFKLNLEINLSIPSPYFYIYIFGKKRKKIDYKFV